MPFISLKVGIRIIHFFKIQHSTRTEMQERSLTGNVACESRQRIHLKTNLERRTHFENRRSALLVVPLTLSHPNAHTITTTYTNKSFSSMGIRRRNYVCKIYKVFKLKQITKWLTCLTNIFISFTTGQYLMLSPQQTFQLFQKSLNV